MASASASNHPELVQYQLPRPSSVGPRRAVSDPLAGPPIRRPMASRQVSAPCSGHSGLKVETRRDQGRLSGLRAISTLEAWLDLAVVEVLQGRSTAA